MADILLSPGVLTREIDQSQITSEPVQAGAAIIGPTVKGEQNIPKLVTSYSEYLANFGSTFLSASNEYTYFTSISAYNYFQNGGTSLLVTRVATGSFQSALSTQISSQLPAGTSSLGLNIAPFQSQSATDPFTSSFDMNGITMFITGSTVNTSNTSTIVFIPEGADAEGTANNITSHFNFSKSLSDYVGSWGLLHASPYNNTFGSSEFVKFSTPDLTGDPAITNAIYIISASVKHYMNDGFLKGSSPGDMSIVGTGSKSISSFRLATLSQGVDQNNATVNYYNTGSGGATPQPPSSQIGLNNTLLTGSSDNLRWEITNSNTASGVFSLVIRRGDDKESNKQVLETWANLSLDPLADNYIERVIGNQVKGVTTDGNDKFISTVGQYPNNSNYIRVDSVNKNLLSPNYFTNNGVAKNEFTASIPLPQSGAFAGGTGELFINGVNYYQNINNTDTQGIAASAYNTAITLMANKDEYRYKFISTPGLILANSNQATPLNTLISNTEQRGDALVIADLVNYNSTIPQVTTEATSINSSYVASYWPWLQIIDPDSRQLVWVPASTIIPGVYAYNDKVAQTWFAPAGTNRGGLGVINQAERKLTNTDRDTLYVGKVNPIATYPSQGVVVFGQKTLQTNASALDRINVRRLLITLKNYISQIADTLVFEQNTNTTRNRFLSQVTPYLESVKQRQGLYAFKVVMDDTNNTPDVIDRNELIGQIYIQPTKTAEFVYLDFNILPTGATFPS